jgi:hypothetical protein
VQVQWRLIRGVMQQQLHSCVALHGCWAWRNHQQGVWLEGCEAVWGGGWRGRGGGQKLWVQAGLEQLHRCKVLQGCWACRNHQQGGCRHRECIQQYNEPVERGS